MAIVLVRVVVLALAGGAGIALGAALEAPIPWPLLAAGGIVVGLLALLLEWGVRRIPMDRLFFGALGGLFGLVLAQAVGPLLATLIPRAGAPARGLLVLLLGYLGVTVALRKGSELEGLTAKLFPRAAAQKEGFKILDTSVIIDGRIADVCETGFLEGTLVVPQFVLRELQQIADSSD
ncbi:MAG: twitching motility protein PilT, partial [candidate division NC10 bacterium]